MKRIEPDWTSGIDIFGIAAVADPSERYAVDDILAPLERLWIALEDMATASDGNSDIISPQNIAATKDRLDVPDTLKYLRRARAEVAAAPATIVWSGRLDLTLHVTDLLMLLSRLVRGLDPELAGAGDWLSVEGKVLERRPGFSELRNRGQLAALASIYPEQVSLRDEGECWLLEKIDFLDGLDLTELENSGPVTFYDCVFHAPVDLTDLHVAAPISFIQCDMKAGLHLDRVRASKNLNFEKVMVSTRMTAKNYRGVLPMGKSALAFDNGCEIDWQGALIEGDFWKKYGVCGPAQFNRIQFAPAIDAAYFELMHFEGRTSFEDANLAHFSFADVVFYKEASFRRCKFGTPSALWGVEFKGPVFFDDVVFVQDRENYDGDLLYILIDDYASFRRIRTEGRLIFSLTASRPLNVSFAYAHFTGPTRFCVGEERVHFDFTGAIFDGDVEFPFNADAAAADFTGAIFNGGVQFGAPRKNQDPR